MLTFDQFLADDNAPAEIRTLTLLSTYREPADVYLIQAPIGEVKIHFDSDPLIKGAFVCPGEKCPKCFLGAKPIEHLILPVYTADYQTVKVLMVLKSSRPSDLLPQLKAVWCQDPEIENKLATITQDGSRFTLTVTSKVANLDSPSAMIRKEVISRFLSAYEADRELIYTAVRRPSVEELREIPSIKNRLIERGELDSNDDTPFTFLGK